VPLLARGEVIGTTGLATGEADREFTPAEVALAETIASQIAGAIDNARLLEETQQHVVELATISNISQALVSQLELNPLIELVGETIRRTFDAQIVYVALLDRQTDLVHFPYYFEVGHRDGGDPVELGQGLVSRVIETGQPLLLTHERQYEELDVARVGTLSKSYLGVPIAVGDGVIGAISVQSTQQGDQFDEADVRLLSTIAASVGVAIERARLYASAQQQKEYFESLVLNNPVAIITIDQTAKIISWNPAAEKLFGYSEAEAIDRNIDDLVARLESVRDQAVDYTQQTMRGGRVHAITQRTRKDGSLVDVEMLALPVTIPGRAIGYIVIYHDITELQRARQAAEAANQAKGNFLANVSHELRTPLTSVMGFAKIIKKRLDDVIFPNVQQQDDRRTQRAMKQVGDNINIILSEGQRLTTLINNVLDLAKIEAGKFEWRRQPVDVAEVVERAIAATSALFEHKDLELVRDIDPDLPSVIGDPDKLIQVVINLISNAVKFTDRGSVTCQVASKDGEVIVRVIDTGIGIALNDLPKVFDEFVQVGDTLTDKPQGTGLGLPICKQIVEHHGGHIWVESQPGVGSTFAFSLPFAAEAAGVRNGEGGKVKEVI